MKRQPGKILISTLFLLASQLTLADTNTLNPSTTQPQETNLNKYDNIWGYSSKGREKVEVVTDDGHVFEAVDVDGYVHLGDMILGMTEDIKQYGLRITQGETAPNFEGNDSLFATKAAIRYPSSGYKWPNGTVPYVYSSSLGSRGRSAMNYAINHWNSKTNLQPV